MKTIVILNSLICLCYLIQQFNRYFYFQIERTFWKRKLYGISFFKIDSGTRYNGGAHSIFSICVPWKDKILRKF